MQKRAVTPCPQCEWLLFTKVRKVKKKCRGKIRRLGQKEKGSVSSTSARVLFRVNSQSFHSTSKTPLKCSTPLPGLSSPGKRPRPFNFYLFYCFSSRRRKTKSDSYQSVCFICLPAFPARGYHHKKPNLWGPLGQSQAVFVPMVANPIL